MFPCPVLDYQYDVGWSRKARNMFFQFALQSLLVHNLKARIQELPPQTKGFRNVRSTNIISNAVDRILTRHVSYMPRCVIRMPPGLVLFCYLPHTRPVCLSLVCWQGSTYVYSSTNVRPTLMGTKNLYENGPNPFFLFETKNSVRVKLTTTVLFQHGFDN